jgi:integrase
VRDGCRTRWDYLRVDEIPAYLDGCADHYRPLAEVLIACGLRISEALALTAKDIDFATWTMRVLRSRKRRGKGAQKRSLSLGGLRSAAGGRPA